MSLTVTQVSGKVTHLIFLPGNRTPKIYDKTEENGTVVISGFDPAMTNLYNAEVKYGKISLTKKGFNLLSDRPMINDFESTEPAIWAVRHDKDTILMIVEVLGGGTVVLIGAVYLPPDVAKANRRMDELSLGRKETIIDLHYLSCAYALIDSDIQEDNKE